MSSSVAYEVQSLIKPISRTRCAGFVTSHFCNSNTEEGDGGPQMCDVILIYPMSLRAAPKTKQTNKKPTQREIARLLWKDNYKGILRVEFESVWADSTCI